MMMNYEVLLAKPFGARPEHGHEQCHGNTQERGVNSNANEVLCRQNTTYYLHHIKQKLRERTGAATSAASQAFPRIATPGTRGQKTLTIT